ncbi:ndor1 [Acrasis kona]|uniref:NADPH-dependent diflavin oxidoreductase 1 n=1 Tax=Acrasis kona TaxID=1008807 RepID=A0AAW2ZDN8_9EUKA
MERRLYVLYGSQTGTAQDLAERVSREAKRRHFRVSTAPIDNCDPNHLTEQCNVIFICSTTGQGDAPDNMTKFMRLILKRSLPQDLFSQMNMTVFGLGDSTYSKFNFVAKKLRNRLIQLGAKEIVKSEYADEQHPKGIDGTAVKWVNDLFTKLMLDFPTDLPIISENTIPDPRYKILLVTEPANQEIVEEGVTCAKVLENDRITSSDHFQSVRHLVIETNLKYGPGDVCAIMPKNLTIHIEALCKRFNLDPNQTFRIQKTDPDAPDFPDQVFTWHTLFEQYLDICGTPRRYFFQLLSQLAHDEEEKDRLEWFGCSDGIDDLYRYNQREKRMYVEIFQDFKKIELETKTSYFLDLISRMQPRYFSIASCKPDRIELCIAIVKFLSPYKQLRTGTCTRYIENLKPNDTVKIWVKKGTMQFPDANTPVIMVGPGTGVAPFRSLLQHHEIKKPTILFFGNRNVKKDFLYENEMYSIKSPFTLSVAFSRDQNEKVYVQHRIRELKDDVWDILKSGGHVFVAGNNKMPKDVREAFVDVGVQNGLSAQEAEEFIAQLEKNKKYQVESWG